MPDATLSAAIKEAYASAPAGDVIHHTLEIYHPSFTQPIRVVLGGDNITAMLEATAPRNASEQVLFLAYQFSFTKPEISSSGVPQCTLEIDNVSREILAQVDLAVHSGSQSLTRVIYREYLHDNLLVGPENDPPLTLTIFDISANVFRIKAVAGFPNLANRKFPAIEYTAAVFPGLVAQ